MGPGFLDELQDPEKLGVVALAGPTAYRHMKVLGPGVDGVGRIVDDEDGVVISVDSFDRLPPSVKQGAIKVSAEVIFEVLLEQILGSRGRARGKEEKVAKTAKTINESAVKWTEFGRAMLPWALSILDEGPVDVEDH